MDGAIPNKVMPGLLDKHGKLALGFAVASSKVKNRCKNCLFDKKKIQKEKEPELQKQKERQDELQKKKEKKKENQREREKKKKKKEADTDEKEENANPSVRFFPSLSDQKGGIGRSRPNS